MLKKLLISITLVLGINNFTFASFDTHQSKLNKFRTEKHTLYKATLNTNIDIDEAAAIIGLESNWNTNIKNKHSSATGYFQYINSTWKHERNMFHKQANISKHALRTDGKANIKIGVLGLNRNKQILADRTKYEVENVKLGDLYIAHLLGVDKAVKIINGNPNALITKYIKITQGNERLFVKNDGTVRTIKEFRLAMDKKLEKERNLYKREAMEYQLVNLIKDKVGDILTSNYSPQPKWYERAKFS